MIGCALLVVLAGGLVAVLLAAAGALLAAGVAAVVTVSVAVVPAALALSRDGLCTRCRRGTVRRAGRELVREERGYGLVTRTAYTSARGYGPGGRPVSGWGTQEWAERVPVTRRTYRVNRRCSRCGAETVSEVVEEAEDFDRE